MPSELLTVQQLAWAAGAVDILAALRLRETDAGTEQPMVAISSPNIPVVKWLADRTGMKVTEVRRSYKRNGCSLHCPDAHVHVHSVTGRWSVTGARATVLLHNLLPFMQLQTEAATQLLEVGLRTPHKPAVAAKMVSLGWVAPEFASGKFAQQGFLQVT